MVWEGNLTIPVSGGYYFELESDDGSQFFFNSFYNPAANITINNDGLHGDGSAVGAGFYVNAGTYPVAATYFEKWGGQSMRLYWTGPGIPRQLVPSSAFSLPTVNSLQAQSTGIAARSEETVLTAAYPNPFADRVRLDFNLSIAASSGTMQVFDNLGQLVKKQQLTTLRQGKNSVDLLMTDIRLKSQSLYLVRISVPGNETQTFRVMSR